MLLCKADFINHVVQIFDADDNAVSFNMGTLCFWHTKTFALGQQTNGFNNNIGFGFLRTDEGPYALNSGKYGGFVFTAFQVLLVRPVEGLWWLS
jgi:hypothetical protein